MSEQTNARPSPGRWERGISKRTRHYLTYSSASGDVDFLLWIFFSDVSCLMLSSQRGFLADGFPSIPGSCVATCFAALALATLQP